jgi:4-hydroxyphenylpyruvate dioxygenase
MNIAHIHFYVENASTWRNWFTQTLGFQPIDSFASVHTQTEVIQSDRVRFLLSSAKTPESPVFAYLQAHPPGVADVAFRVADLDGAIAQATAAGTQLTRSPYELEQPEGYLKAAQIQGWGDVRHTLVQDRVQDRVQNSAEPQGIEAIPMPLEIDHVVLNVEQGNLGRAIDWYEKAFGFQRRQAFAIQTERSGLCSQVLIHPAGNAQLPINEPASSGSQIQEFLDFNRGAGIQHIALRTSGIVEAIARLRHQGLAFLAVPSRYYEQLRQRPGFPLTEVELAAIAAQEVLVDWQSDRPQAVLLQTFTQPIFSQPTFFFELIERRWYWWNQQQQQAQGFGEGNFRALFEAIEQEQLKRGSLR